ncbi:hypothetical protein GUITHDRAFT_162826 [Guillardia theta CCMP2712]|uniref:Poly(A) polymerase n=1 Tax=Guillardia theta (strain CCMP2712) TaxID=905079 RepID=L1JEA5_GUITC|nr:hypothetical protein GUITHDRAFT_162826 [Guillardia theta CCMP2712]EKX46853.1 hypothetical protein GUITHDRAFT_162826 [Guillardia theta CCMP2712]|eukprot:XP_005833833.1 hypothetical protein GUITHDRAFT_162826 [Guillardia theta CCMP2712]
MSEDEADAMRWIYKGLGEEKKIEYKVNKKAQPLSFDGPSVADMQLNDKLMETLKQLGAYEDKECNKRREQALENIEKIMKTWTCEICKTKNISLDFDCSCRVAPFGSYCLGVHSHDSDIDLLCIIPEVVNRSEFFSRVPAKLAEVEGITCIKSLADAFAPVIKFQYCGFDIDLGMVRMPCGSIPPDLNIALDRHLLRIEDTKDITCLNGPRVTYELLQRVPNIENFKVLLRAIKLWARRREIYSKIIGFPGGVAWGIMAAQVAQLYPKMCPSLLLEKFFHLYKHWKFEDAIIVAPPEECQAPDGQERYNLHAWDPTRRHFSRRPLTVITPTYPMDNSTFNVTDSALNVIRNEISRANSLTQGLAQGESSYNDLFEPAMFFKQYGTFVQIEVLGSEKHIEAFSGYVESQIRKLVEKLTTSQLGLYIVHPCTRHFGPIPAEHLGGGDPEDGPWQNIFFYLGLKFDDNLVRHMKASGQSVDFTQPVKEFLLGIHITDPTQTSISIKVVKRRALPEWVKKEYYSQSKFEGMRLEDEHGELESAKKRALGEASESADATSNGRVKKFVAEALRGSEV